MKYPRTGSGYRFFHCDTKAGGEGGAGGAGGGQTPPDDKGKLADDILKNLDLSPEEAEKIKNDPALLKLVGGSILAKREANAEAKKYREELDAKKKAEEDAEKERLAKKGEHEKLYLTEKEAREKAEGKLKDAVVQKALSVLAVQHGLKNKDYLKLFDVSSLKVDTDKLEVDGIEGKFEQFKKDHSELFGEPGGQTQVPNGRPTTPPAGADEKLKALKEKAEKTRSPRDLAAYHKAVQESQKK